MRLFLLFLGWSCIVGALADGAIGLFALWLIADGGWIDIAMTVETLLKNHLPLIYGLRQVAQDAMPAGFVEWLFALPALIYFPARVAMSAVIGWWAFAAAKKLSAPSGSWQREHRALFRSR